MFRDVDAALLRLYPSHTWGEPDDEARFGAGVCEHDGEALADELADALDASTFYRPGDAEEYCDYIYVLCVGRQPSLIQVRDAGVPLPEEIRADPTPIREQYLRVCVSTMARFAAVQQVAVSLDHHEGSTTITEAARPGVYDAPLLKRFQRLVAILPAYDIVHLDFGEISAPPSGFSPGNYASLYGGLPHTANYLFFPQPSNMRNTTFL